MSELNLDRSLYMPCGSAGDESYFVPIPLEDMWGPDGKRYGSEWPLDAFDAYADSFLLTNLSSENKAAQSALDIGCGNGNRISSLVKLDLFGNVYGCDIEIRDYFRRAATHVTNHQLPSFPIRFVQKNIVALRPEDFEGTTFDYINCRNVGHFLSPADFRTALGNIALLAREGGLVTISFDEGDAEHALFSFATDDLPHFYRTHQASPPDINPTIYAAHINYVAKEVRAFMQGIGYELLPLSSDVLDWGGHSGEHLIAALAPGPQAARLG